jgi:hypothetical protein
MSHLTPILIGAWFAIVILVLLPFILIDTRKYWIQICPGKFTAGYRPSIVRQQSNVSHLAT